MSTSKSGLIQDYLEAKKLASEYKKQENDLRVRIVEQFFPSAGEGTHTTDFKGWEIKAGVRYNYKFDAKSLEEYEYLFNEAEAACVKRKPELQLSAYRKLSDEERATIDSCVVVTPGLPTLDIEEL
jgi:hypothetical protein